MLENSQINNYVKYKSTRIAFKLIKLIDFQELNDITEEEIRDIIDENWIMETI